MAVEQTGAIGRRPIEDAPTSHPWQWLCFIVGGAVVCFAAVAAIVTLLES